MPIYEYKCRKCSYELELMQKPADPQPETCAQCGAIGSFERMVSRTSFQLKGSGWYSDLYSSPKKDATTTGSAPASGSESSSSTSATPATGSSTSSSSGGANS